MLTSFAQSLADVPVAPASSILFSTSAISYTGIEEAHIDDVINNLITSKQSFKEYCIKHLSPVAYGGQKNKRQYKCFPGAFPEVVFRIDRIWPNEFALN